MPLVTVLGYSFNQAFVSPAYGPAIWVPSPTDPLSSVHNFYDSANHDPAGGSPGWGILRTYRVYPNWTYNLNPAGDKIVVHIREDHLAAMEGTVGDIVSAATVPHIEKDGSHDVWIGGYTDIDLKGPGWGPQLGLGGPPPFPKYAAGITIAIGTPYMAGVIRAGELLNGIYHALNFSADGAVINGHDAPPGSAYFHVWPATSNDDLNPQYQGGNLYEGGLYALHPSFDINGHIVTPEARSIAHALQDYGAYLTNRTTGLGNVMVMSIDWATARYDLPGDAGYRGTSSAAQFQADINYMVNYLYWISNSYHYGTGDQPIGGYKLDGGDGTLRAPLAPPFNR